MKKYRVLLDILKDKVIFLPEYSKYQRSISPPLVPVKPKPTITPAVIPIVPLKKPSITILRRPPSLVYEDLTGSGYEDGPILHKKKRKKKRPNLPTLDLSSSKKSDSEPERINIHQVNTASYFHLAKQPDIQLFSLTISEIHNALGINPSASDLDPSDSTTLPYIKKKPSSRNKPCPCGSNSKFKKCCGSWMKDDVQVNATHLLEAEIKSRLPSKYHDFLDVFDKDKVDVLPPHRPYDYKLEFTEEGY